MTLRVVGAGLGRTGTHSLKLALERVLGGPCYHMLEVLSHHEYVRYWQDALDGKPVDWQQVMNGYVACVDWPAAAWWREIWDANPDAIVLLSTRSSADAWWKSAHDTIFDISARELPDDPVMREIGQMPKDMLARKFTPNWNDEAAAKQAYEQHNADVRASVPAARLVDWQPGDGWQPICDALGVPVPDEPFPHVNSTSDFRTMLGLDA
ncbi:MAG TPA: sulfotransferase [Acidimicrobiia bacterium]|nr:sulfotransferase [Acidimicrobiia bacterium]